MKNQSKACECGAEPPFVGTIKSKRSTAGGSWYVACLHCGRVGIHGRTEKQAIENWNKGRIYLKGIFEL